ncbi:MAG: hypothetical protein IKP96_01825 [Elusimicrobiaceae bacterium]|nr:hypothetical protein [Elusimicrobiaceae bacterium]
MKRSMLFLATLVLVSAAYAQTNAPSFSQEQVLDIFERFNPSVLQKAEKDPTYRAALDYFLASYSASQRPVDRYELIGVARNFDNSLRLRELTDMYQQVWLSAKVSGASTAVSKENFTRDVTGVMQNIWAVTVQLRQYQLEQDRALLKQIAQDEKLSVQERREAIHAVEDEIKHLKAEIKAFKKNPGKHVVSAAEDYVSQVERELQERDFSVKHHVAQQHEQAARQSSNLQIKTNHKKPVAK